MDLNISEEAAIYMKAHAEETYPYECCGFLYGSDGKTRFIRKAVRVKNSQEGDQRRRFEISPLDYMKAEKYALEQDITLLGIYHSHPDHPAIPSRHDFKQALPFFSYVILSVGSGTLVRTTSWQLVEGKFEMENISKDNQLTTENK